MNSTSVELYADDSIALYIDSIESSIPSHPVPRLDGVDFTFPQFYFVFKIFLFPTHERWSVVDKKSPKIEPKLASFDFSN